MDELLTKFNGYNEGTTADLSAEQRRALAEAGMIGARGGLTRKGSIAAQRAQREQMDRLFPL